MLRFAPLAIALATFVLGLAFPWLKTPLIIGLSYGFAALGVSVLIRAGQVSFGHAFFTCLAGYAAVALARAWPAADGLVLLVAGTLGGTVAGAVAALFMVRYRGIFFGMLNLAMSMVLFALLGKLYNVTGGTDGLRLERPPLFGQLLERAEYETWLLALCGALVVAACGVLARFQASPTGEALAALRTNEVRLEYLGLSARAIFYRGYVVSALLCALSGGLFALVQGMVTPEMGYWVRSGEYVFIAVLGGTLHPVGAFIGALVFEFLKLYAAAALTGAWQLVMGAVLLALIFLAPAGIVAWLVRRPRLQPVEER